MSIDRSIQTGVMIGQAIQTRRLRQEVAQLQQHANTQQQRQSHLEGWRNRVNEGRQLLDEAEDLLNQNARMAVYLTRVAYCHLSRMDASPASDLLEKEVFHHIRQRVDALLVRGEVRLHPDVSHDLHRLAWLDQVRQRVASLEAALTVEETLQESSGLFTPAPGGGRSALLFFGGMIVANVLGAMSWAMFHVAVLSCILFLLFNGVTALIFDGAARSKVLRKCAAIGAKANVQIQEDITPKTAGEFVQQVKDHLRIWGFETKADASWKARKELAAIDAEIAQLRQLYFPT